MQQLIAQKKILALRAQHYKFYYIIINNFSSVFSRKIFANFPQKCSQFFSRKMLAFFREIVAFLFLQNRKMLNLRETVYHFCWKS